MGAHWKALGYESALDLADRAMSGIDGQVELMARFIRHKGLTDDLNSHNWAAFAKFTMARTMELTNTILN